MSRALDIARRALDGIPGWTGATLSPLKGGLTNTTWLVEENGRRAVLKADTSVRGFPFAGREAEADIQRLAARMSLATDVIYASPTVLLTDFVDGTPWTAADLKDAANLASLGRLLRRVHALPQTGRRFDAVRAARHYAERIAQGADTDAALVNEHVEITGSSPVSDQVCCCHNDVVAENILATPELRLIDWEYAADNNPLFDIAVVVVHHDLDDGQASCLLDSYAGTTTHRLSAGLRREVRRYRSLAWLWRAASP